MDQLHGADALRWARLAVTRLAEQHAAIDAINVFPVADSDTGTNSLLTVRGGLEAAEGVEGSAAQVLAAFARGALVSARGNSGVIVSQFVAGLAAHLAEEPVADAAALARALRAGQRAAHEAVARPVSGTVLTALERVAEVADGPTGGLDGLALAVLEAAREEARRSPERLAVLAEAGVLDAGSCVLVVLLEALVETVTGSPAPGAGELLAGTVPPVRPAEPCEHLTTDGEFELMLLLEAGTQAGPAVRAALDAHGSSVAVVGAELGSGGGLWQLHVHTDVPDRALAEVCRIGRHRQVVVRHLALPPAPLGLVVAAPEPGLLAHLARAGAVVHVPSEPPATPAELARAVTDAGGERVLLLAADEGTLAAARALAEPRLAVLPVRDSLHAVLVLGELLAAEVAPEDAVELARSVAARARTGTEVAVLGPLEGLVTILHGARAPAARLEALEAELLAAGAAEVLLIGTGLEDEVVRFGAVGR